MLLIEMLKHLPVYAPESLFVTEVKDIELP